MARNYTKYTVEGLGENLNKRQLVFAIVKDWASKNNPSLDEIQKAFPNETQGSKGFVVKESEVKNSKGFNMQEPLKIKNENVVVSNQWGSGNIADFLSCAAQLGYQINEIGSAKSEDASNKMIDLSNFEVWKLAEFFQSKEENQKEMDMIDGEIDSLLEENPKFFIIGKLFEKYGYEYDNDDINDYFSLGEDNDFDEDELLSMLRDETLLPRIIKKEKFEDTMLSAKHTDFILLFSGYFIKALELLAYSDDKEMLAEFIVNQSIQTIEGEYKVEDIMGDWIGDITAELIDNIYGYNISDYDGECEIDGYYFGQANSMGYDFHSYAQDIIDSII